MNRLLCSIALCLSANVHAHHTNSVQLSEPSTVFSGHNMKDYQIIDLTRDGTDEIVFTNESGQLRYQTLGPEIQSKVLLPNESDSIKHFQVVDINKDGINEIVFSNEAGQLKYARVGPASSIVLLRNDSIGKFSVEDEEILYLNANGDLKKVTISTLEVIEKKKDFIIETLLSKVWTGTARRGKYQEEDMRLPFTTSDSGELEYKLKVLSNAGWTVISTGQLEFDLYDTGYQVTHNDNFIISSLDGGVKLTIIDTLYSGEYILN